MWKGRSTPDGLMPDGAPGHAWVKAPELCVSPKPATPFMVPK